MSKRARPVPAPAVPAVESRTLHRLALLALVAAVGLAYCNTLNVPYIFDDFPTIEKNESIRDLTDIGRVLQPPTEGGSGVSGRPLVNLTLAINYAISGLKPWSYHLFNTVVHALAALALFGLVRRTLLGPILRERWREPALPVAFVSALLWAVHPLLTESVTCIIQRTESLFGLFYLFTLYTFARAAETSDRVTKIRWGALSVVTCAVGMATKEAMVTAPLIVLLYDRTFISGSFRGAMRHRWVYYGLFASWILLFYLLQGNPMRGGTAGYEKVSSWEYLLTQCRGIVIYLKLSLWPHPLVLDYGTGVSRSLAAVWPQALLLVGLATGTFWALGRRPVIGFLGAWFFIILSPSSSVVPLVTQTLAEHRMYLPLVAIVTLAVGLLARRSVTLLLPAGLAVAFVAGIVTLSRNALYHDAHAMWSANLAHWPENERVYGGLANAADEAGNFAEAAGYYEAFLAHRPDDALIRFNYARDLVKSGRRPEAIPQFEQVLKLLPENTEARTNYAACLLALERWDEGIHQMQLILRLGKGNAIDNFNLAEAFRKTRRVPEALEQYEKALARQPREKAGFMQSRYGDTLLMVNRYADAAGAYRAAVEAQPELFGAWMNLGGSLMTLERVDEAIRAYEGALRAQPHDPAALKNLEFARSQLRR